MPRIFISYRRDDSAGYAGRIYDALTARYGREQVFMDVDNIRAGEDFVKAIQDKVAASDVLLAVIGPEWLGTSDEFGRQRLQNSGDFVRIEIAHALALGIRVVPVLVGKASMPGAVALPADLKALSTINALEIHDGLFGDSVKRLIRELGDGRSRWRGLWISVPILAIVTVVVFLQLTSKRSIPPAADDIEAARRIPGLDQTIKKPERPIKLRIPAKIDQLPAVIEGARMVLRAPGVHTALGPRKPKVLWEAYVPGSALGIAADGTIFAWDSGSSNLSAVRGDAELWSFGFPYSNAWSPEGFDSEGRIWLSEFYASNSKYCFNSVGEGGKAVASLPRDLELVHSPSQAAGDRAICEGGQVTRQRSRHWTVEIDGNCPSWGAVEDAKGDSYTSSDAGTLYSISAEGKVRWSHQMGFQTEAPAFVMGDVLVGGKDGLYRFHNGVLLWKYRAEHGVSASQVFDREGTVYVHEYDHIKAVDANGKQVWTLKSGTWPFENTTEPFGLDERGRLYVVLRGGIVCLSDK